MSILDSKFPDAFSNEALLQQKVNLLERSFRSIQQHRMREIPIMNNAIKVRAVGFRHWQNSYIGILITPWFMNLILLPGESDNWDDLHELTKKTHSFPSGKYSFITAYEEDIGKYQLCSLFSPMFEFGDDASAVETAQIVMKELFNEDNISQTDIQSDQIEAIWNGSESIPDDIVKAKFETDLENLTDDQKQEIIDQPSITDKLNKPISRRDLLRGSLSGSDN